MLIEKPYMERCDVGLRLDDYDWGDEILMVEWRWPR